MCSTEVLYNILNTFSSFISSHDIGVCRHLDRNNEFSLHINRCAYRVLGYKQPQIFISTSTSTTRLSTSSPSLCRALWPKRHANSAELVWVGTLRWHVKCCVDPKLVHKIGDGYHWLVVYLPLWKKKSSVIIIPTVPSCSRPCLYHCISIDWACHHWTYHGMPNMEK